MANCGERLPPPLTDMAGAGGMAASTLSRPSSTPGAGSGLDMPGDRLYTVFPYWGSRRDGGMAGFRIVDEGADGGKTARQRVL